MTLLVHYAGIRNPLPLTTNARSVAKTKIYDSALSVDFYPARTMRRNTIQASTIPITKTLIHGKAGIL